MRALAEDSHKRGLPDINSCIAGFIQYKPTKNITDKLKKTKAPPSKKVWSLKIFALVGPSTIPVKF